jgi:hypothetical protein
MGFQAAPAGEAVSTRDGELGIRKLCLAAVRAHAPQMLFGSFAKPVEVCPCGQGVGHGNTFFQIGPASALTGRKKAAVNIVRRRVRPSSRTDGRLVNRP